MTGDTCPTCGQALPPQDDCICGHSKAMHHFTPGRRKTECSRFGPKGKCPCESYRPLEMPETLTQALGLEPGDEEERQRGLKCDFDAIRDAERAAWEERP